MGFGLASAQIAMPDPALIHGKAIPAPELPNGTVTVRVVREAIGNNVVGQEVRVTTGAASRTGKTDAQGRALFPNLPQGVEGRATASVNGEALTSDPFTVPSSGGLRVILVAGLKEAAARAASGEAQAAAAPPVRGTVVFGPNSRFFLEFRDDTLRAFYVLDVVNSARARVDTGGPLILNLPRGAAGATMLEGSSPTATVSGDRVTVTSPFAAGSTSVRVAFQLRYDRAEMTVEQTLPAALEQPAVGVEKIGSLSIASPQFSTVGEVKAENGTPFLLGSGPALPGGATLVLHLSNLPVHSRMPRYVALGLALAIIAIGTWFAFTARAKEPALRHRLAERRDTLLGELAALDRKARRSGSASASDEARRRHLVAELERVYGELEEVSGAPGGGGEDLAA